MTTARDTSIPGALARRLLPAVLAGLALLGVTAASARVVETGGVAVEVPDAFDTSKSSRGIKLQTADKEVILWLETYAAADKAKVMREYDRFWRKNEVALGQPSVRDFGEPGGTPREATDFTDAKWRGAPTVVRYVSVGPAGADGRTVLFTLWASPEGFKRYGDAVLGVLRSADLGARDAAPAPSSAAPSSATPSAAAPGPAPPGPATLADLDAQERATAAVWERLPFSTRHAMFVTRKANAYGDYEARPSNVFAPGEALLTYLEPLGYAWAAQGDAYRFGVTVDFEILSQAGEVLAGQKGLLTQAFVTRYRNREFFLNSTMSVDGAPAGAYVLAYILHDLGSGRTTRVEQPFSIAGEARSGR